MMSFRARSRTSCQPDEPFQLYQDAGQLVIGWLRSLFWLPVYTILMNGMH